MKKKIALALTVMLAISLTACGGDKPVENKQEGSKKEEEAKQEEKEEAVQVEGEKIETPLASLIYNPDIWNYVEEEDLYSSDTVTRIEMRIPEGEDDYEIYAKFSVDVDDPYSFRDNLVEFGLDEYEYEVNKAYETEKIGGVELIPIEGTYWGDPCMRYLNRFEGANMTVKIEIYGDHNDQRVKDLLAGLSVTCTDIGNVDGPYYWEGEPYAQEPHSAMAGTYTLNSEWIPFVEHIRTRETFKHNVAVSGDQVYILTEGILKQYAFDGSALTYVQDIAIEEDAVYEEIQAASDGSIWISTFMHPLMNIKDGVVVASYDDTDKVYMHSSGTWGISWFSNPETEKITIADGVISRTPMTFAEVKTISDVTIDDSYIYICGTAADDNAYKIFLYNHDGAHQMTLTQADGKGLGSVTAVFKTANGFLAMDGNMRQTYLWTADGTFVGGIEDAELFGTFYPWYCASDKLSDGSILTIMTEERSDKSAMELVAYKFGGF